MPLYEYQCDACGHRFERIVKFSDPPVETCPKCGGRVQKLISSPAFQFKGSGWYATDYAKKSDNSKGDGSKSDAGGESKPAAGADKGSTASSGTDASKESSGTKPGGTSDSAPKKDTSTPPSKS